MTVLEEMEKIYLEHYGVKGMQWGVRRERRKGKRADKKWMKNIASHKGQIAVHNAAADIMNNGVLRKLNKKYEGTGLNLITNPTSKIAKQYLQDHDKESVKAVKQAIKEVHGTSPTGKFTASLDRINGVYGVRVTENKVEHADDKDEGDTLFEFKVDFDDIGRIVKMSAVKPNLSQTTMDGEQFLEHYGVKGMQWGVRKSRTKKETAAIRARKQLKDRRRTLDDKTLNEAIKRLGDEKKLKQLVNEDVAPGRTVAKALLSSSGKKIAGTALTGAGLFAMKTFVKSRAKDPHGNQHRTRFDLAAATELAGLMARGKEKK